MKQTIENLFIKSPHILIVDDDKEHLGLLLDCLSDQQGHIYQARTGELAQKILIKNTVDLVITDWQLPGISGLELIQELRALDFRGPLLICTGMMLSSEHLRMAFEAGASDYLRKPFNRVELNARLNNSLRLYAQHEALQHLNTSQTRFINFMSEHLGQDLQHLIQLQKQSVQSTTGSQSSEAHAEEHILTQNLSQQFQKLMNWGRYRFALQEIPFQTFALKDLLKSLEYHFNTYSHRLFLRGGRELQVYSAPELLRRILIQLLDNAFKYSEGTVTLKISQTDQRLRFEVQDSGTISEDQLFDLCQNQNTGLGLEICHDLLTLLNSQLQGKRGKNGSRFFFDVFDS